MNCHACKCHVTPVKPRTMWKVGVVAFWITSLVVAVGFGSIVGLSLFLAPVAIAVGMAIGTSARRLSSWTCPRCDAELLEPEPNTTLTTAPLASIARET
ncbi:MAG: hypothetical protein KIT84_43675 [Labilithrix sp.]|nr:hypothetical protein [Labilithrix sp.]MCW5817980.1 hypothetical protein [Labilithrix sp.]